MNLLFARLLPKDIAPYMLACVGYDRCQELGLDLDEALDEAPVHALSPSSGKPSVTESRRTLSLLTYR